MREYFSRDPAHAFFPEGRTPSSNYVKTTVIPQLEQVCKPSQDTCFRLWSVLSLLCHPKELNCLDNTVLLSRCILALRCFTDEIDPQANKVSTASLSGLALLLSNDQMHPVIQL